MFLEESNKQKERVSDNWLITGGCGFIGVNFIDRLLAGNPHINLRVLDNISVGCREDLAEVCKFSEISWPEVSGAPRGVELVVGDLTEFEVCRQCCAGIDAVVHLAANTGVAPSVEDPRKDMEINAVGTFNILEAARANSVKKFIFASSGATLGEVTPPVHEEQVPKPVSPYGASKLAGEAYCSAYYKTFGLETVILRFGNAYGPRSKHKGSVVARFFRQALTGKPLMIYGDGNQTRDFIYIADLVQAMMLSIGAEVGGEVFQIATHKECTINELAQMLRKLVAEETGKQVSIIYQEPLPADVRRNFSDISKAKKYLGFEPRYSLEDGLKETLRYFIHQLGKS
jgi:UDP-glucose 4-epimerase